MSDYRALRSFTKFGTALAVLAGLLVPVSVAAIMQVWVWNWPVLAVSVVLGAFVGFLIKVLAELARVIVEMLLPRTD